MLNSYVSIPHHFNEKFQPYLMGGLGLAHNKTTNIYWPLAVQTEFGHDTNRLAWQVGIGSLYSLSNSVDIDFNYTFLNIGNITNTGQYDAVASNGTPTSGAPTQLIRAYSNQLQVGLHYRFA